METLNGNDKRDRVVNNGRIPYLIWGLIALNTLLFASRVVTKSDLLSLDSMKLIPSQFVSKPSENGYRVVSSVLGHADLLHLFFNMYALWTFGSPLEKAIGPWHTLGLYAFGGIGSNLLYSLVYRKSDVGVIGASAAISSIAAAYFLQFAEHKSMANWVTFQLVGLLLYSQSNISYASHLIGFVLGALYFLIFLRKPSVKTSN